MTRKLENIISKLEEQYQQFKQYVAKTYNLVDSTTYTKEYRIEQLLQLLNKHDSGNDFYRFYYASLIIKYKLNYKSSQLLNKKEYEKLTMFTEQIKDGQNINISNLIYEDEYKDKYYDKIKIETMKSMNPKNIYNLYIKIKKHKIKDSLIITLDYDSVFSSLLLAYYLNYKHPKTTEIEFLNYLDNESDYKYENNKLRNEFSKFYESSAHGFWLTLKSLNRLLKKATKRTVLLYESSNIDDKIRGSYSYFKDYFNKIVKTVLIYHKANGRSDKKTVYGVISNKNKHKDNS